MSRPGPPQSTNWQLSSASSFCLRCSNIYSQSRSESWTPASWVTLGNSSQNQVTSKNSQMWGGRQKVKCPGAASSQARSEVHIHASLCTVFPNKRWGKVPPWGAKLTHTTSLEWPSHEAEPNVGPECKAWPTTRFQSSLLTRPEARKDMPKNGGWAPRGCQLHVKEILRLPRLVHCALLNVKLTKSLRCYLYLHKQRPQPSILSLPLTELQWGLFGQPHPTNQHQVLIANQGVVPYVFQGMDWCSSIQESLRFLF